MNVTFSVNQYDSDGDMFDKCVLLHFENTILRFQTVEELEEFKEGIEKCLKEIKGE